jgi:hypothetical protein
MGTAGKEFLFYVANLVAVSVVADTDPAQLFDELAKWASPPYCVLRQSLSLITWSLHGRFN